MLQIFDRFLCKRKRASITRELDHLYADMRQAAENTRLAKLFAEQEERKVLEKLQAQERKLTAEAKQLDALEITRSIPTRAARAW